MQGGSDEYLDDLDLDEEECGTGAPPESQRAELALHVHSQTLTSARFLLQLREGRQLSQVAVSDVTTGCKTLCKQATDGIKEGIKATPGLTDVLSNDPHPFQDIDTNYLFEKFCLEHLGVLVSLWSVHACIHENSKHIHRGVKDWVQQLCELHLLWC